ncbi:Protein CBG24335 [Caenorhabditis briggsae]|uniref:Protein CBG24335 n=1 Tax=Caenorhabditis briggsae TaxID=6238 RepID=A8WKH4_CAEBR|nr:Protein CBG24335 [Caenorhabditis briggsae]CAP20969.1 Protein CBG24335 [Caenorhabditis briggsae]
MVLSVFIYYQLAFFKFGGTRNMIKSRYFYSSKGLDLLVTNLEERVKLDLKKCRGIINDVRRMELPRQKAFTAFLGSSLDSQRNIPAMFRSTWKHAKLITKNLDKFNIDKSSVVCITRDGATTMSSLCSNLNMKSIHCYAHLLQLVNFSY